MNYSTIKFKTNRPLDRIVRRMQRRTTAKIILLVAISGFFIAWVGIPNVAYALNPYKSAIGQLARAESAQTPNEVVYYVTNAKQQLPESGIIVWWSAKKGNFESLQTELDDIISRARNISSLELRNELFNSEMYDIHAKLKIIQETLLA